MASTTTTGQAPIVNADAAGQAPAVTAPADNAGAQAAQAQTAATGNAAQAGRLEDLPEWWQKEIRSLRDENAGRRTAEKAAQEAQAAAEAKRLADSQQWQTLAENRAETIAQLKPLAEVAESLAQAANDEIDAEIANLPEELRAMDPGAANVTARKAWAKQARSLVVKLTAAVQPGNGRGPSPAGVGRAAALDSLRAEIRSKIRA